ncbi:MAG TPA: polysaccharide biosynthesis protein [Bacteroidales bacterium]|nr:polysaccharide biosynthesis protein [Bacteroidales bacterium]
MVDTLFLRKHSPRWVVLLIDTGISFFSLSLAFLLRFNFKITEEFSDLWLYAVAFVVGIRLLSFIISKTYAGIVRYTTGKDAERIFLVVAGGSAFIAIVNFAFYFYISDSYLVPFSVILIDFFICGFLLTASRFVVKAVFARFTENVGNRTNVIIYGADHLGIVTKDTLERDTKINYRIIAFIDDSTNIVGKKIDGIDVYHSDKLNYLLELHTISSVIIAKKNVTKDEKNNIADICIHHYVKLLTLPDFGKWINGELSVNQIRNINISDLLERDPIQLDKEQIKREVSEYTILVTGAAGSIGSEIVRQLTQFEPKLIVLFDQAESPLYDLELELKEKFNFRRYEIVIGDITNRIRINRTFEAFKPDMVYHAAAYKHVPMMENNPIEAVTNNIFGTKMVADMSVEHGVRKFVMISTDKAVNPTNVMGASKRIAEIYCQSLGKNSSTSFITTRFGNVLGSNGSVIPRFKAQIEAGGPVTVTDARITRYFMTIPEACQLVLEASAMGKGGEIFVFDMGQSVKIVDLAKKMIRLSGLKIGKDIELSFTGLRPGEKLYEELLNNEENTLPTYHPQIMIGKVREYNFEEVKAQLHELAEIKKTHDNYKIVGMMKAMVPEFLSQNSEFEKLDVAPEKKK